MTRGLAVSSEAALRGVWAERLGVAADAFDRPGPTFVERSDLAAVVVVRLGATTAVAAPERALRGLRSLAPAQLVDVGALLGAVEALRPNLLGAASLSFGDAQSIVPCLTRSARPGTEAEVETVLSGCSVAEREESGLSQMAMRWIVSNRHGDPGGAAGYEVWNGALAHVGAAVDAESRGQGLGLSAASAAVLHAIGAGLVPQWRCRRGNVTSARLSERLGFVTLGDQVTIDLVALETV